MAKVFSSPLVSASNNIILFSRGAKQLSRVQRQLVQFDKFIKTKTIEIEKDKLPSKKKIKELANLNVASTFGSPSGLLSGLASGALDIAGFLGNMFPARGKTGKPGRLPARIKAPKPTVRGSNLKLGGLRAVGVVNALFAGLDFATGLQEGESVGKSATGAVGSLAGSLLGGAIGQALIPIPGVGFVLGSMAGGFLGGYTADRVYEGGSYIKKKLNERLKKQEAAQAQKVASNNNFDDIVNKFSESVGKFENFVYNSFANVINAAASASGSAQEGAPMEYGPPEPELQPGKDTGQELQDVEAEGGKKPSRSIITSRFGPRNGRQHYGTDYGENAGTPVSVIQPGNVQFAGYTSGGGNTVHIDHPDGSQTRYLHFQKTPNVKTGQQIEPGTVIGYVGNTGRSRGPHLHFEYAPPGQGSIDSAPYADKYFRFGGNVKVKPKAGVSRAGSNPFVLELHADPNAKGQKTGLIPSNISPDTAVSQALVSSFGTYGKNYRGGLGVTNRGGNILETDMAVGAKKNAEEIVKAMLKDPKRAYHIFAGHADVTKGETGAPGEKEYNLRTAELVEKLATARGLNLIYHRSINANNPGDPNSNFSRIEAIMKNASKSQATQPTTTPQVQSIPKPLVTQKKLEQYPTYNQQQSSVTIMPIMMGGNQGGGGQQQKPVFIPVGGGGGGTVVLPGPSEGQIVNSLIKSMLLTNLSGT
jgi:murein DD-endopeptidase MepM/ murein hydrolase activator NlpD